MSDISKSTTPEECTRLLIGLKDDIITEASKTRTAALHSIEVIDFLNEELEETQTTIRFDSSGRNASFEKLLATGGLNHNCRFGINSRSAVSHDPTELGVTVIWLYSNFGQLFRRRSSSSQDSAFQKFVQHAIAAYTSFNKVHSR